MEHKFPCTLWVFSFRFPWRTVTSQLGFMWVTMDSKCWKEMSLLTICGPNWPKDCIFSTDSDGLGWALRSWHCFTTPCWKVWSDTEWHPGLAPLLSSVNQKLKTSEICNEGYGNKDYIFLQTIFDKTVVSQAPNILKDPSCILHSEYEKSPSGKLELADVKVSSPSSLLPQLLLINSLLKANSLEVLPALYTLV